MQRKNIVRLIAIAIVVTILVLLALPKLSLMGQPGEEGGAASAERRQNVKVMVAEPTYLSDNITVTGTILADEEVELTTETAGKITGIYFEEGNRVNKGKLLVKINDEVLQSRVRKLTHQLKLARDREYRLRQLLEREAVSRDEYDNALTNLEMLQADSAQVVAEINQTEIRAPFSGMTGLRMVSEGAFVSSNTSVASLVRMQPLKVEFSVPEKYVNSISRDQKITFTTASIPGEFEATVYAFEPKLDVSTRSLTVRARYPNAERKLIPGLYASVDLKLRTFDDAIMIPTEALIPDIGGSKVFKVKDGKADQVFVKTGKRNERRVQVTDGIKAGDTVIVSGILQVRPGMPVVTEPMDSLFLKP